MSPLATDDTIYRGVAANPRRPLVVLKLMHDGIVSAPFDQPTLPASLCWHCEPRAWSIDVQRRSLRIEPEAATDFWQRTHYGFRVDNGHYLHTEQATGDFVLRTRVAFRPVHQYDQAGVMVRFSESCWIKASVEYEPHGPGRLGAVVTNFGYSDWSTQDHPAGAGQIWLRARREADDYIIDASSDGKAWSQIRMAHLHESRGASVTCGVYACSPMGRGFAAEFDELTIVRGRI